MSLKKLTWCSKETQNTKNGIKLKIKKKMMSHQTQMMKNFEDYFNATIKLNLDLMKQM